MISFWSLASLLSCSNCVNNDIIFLHLTHLMPHATFDTPCSHDKFCSHFCFVMHHTSYIINNLKDSIKNEFIVRLCHRLCCCSAAWHSCMLEYNCYNHWYTLNRFNLISSIYLQACWKYYQNVHERKEYASLKIKNEKPIAYIFAATPQHISNKVSQKSIK